MPPSSHTDHSGEGLDCTVKQQQHQNRICQETTFTTRTKAVSTHREEKNWYKS